MNEQKALNYNSSSVSAVSRCLMHVISYDCRACDGPGCMWPIHPIWQPDLWPSTGSNKCHCQGSSWCLHTGTVTLFFLFFMIFFNVSPQSEVLPACHMTAHYSPLLSSWAPSWIPNMNKLRYVWQWTCTDLVPAALLLGSDVLHLKANMTTLNTQDFCSACVLLVKSGCLIMNV